ncbi:MAG TPA: TonB-dependent receptor [Puia sp.]|jgi:TonB-linked SusC/RagA family outer membrane protein
MRYGHFIFGSCLCLFLQLFISGVNAQDGSRQIVKGYVINDSGYALHGASVRLIPNDAGKSYLTSTDSAGMFTFTNVVAGRTYDFEATYVGYKTGKVQGLKILGGKTNTVMIRLYPTVRALNDVVVIAYGTQKKGDVSSAMSIYKPNEYDSRPVLAPDQMMQGKMAGVLMDAGSGTPGAANRVNIRGIGSLSASNDPLYVIDGIPIKLTNGALGDFGEDMSSISELNPSDIESITVLKDAASASIYGSRATNGVVLIKTKSGQKNKSRLDFNAFSGVANVPYLNRLKIDNSASYVQVVNEAIDSYNLQYGYAPGRGNFVDYIRNPYPGLPDFDWTNAVLNKNARTNSANLSLSGGSTKNTYFISMGYLDQDGTIKTNNLKKYTGKINLTQEIFPWLNFGANTNFSFSRNNRVPGANLGSTPLARSLEQRPFDRPYKPNGEYYIGGTSELLRNNAVQILNEEKAYLEDYRMLGNFHLDISILKGLVLKNSLGTDVDYTHDYVYYNQDHPYGLGTGRLTDQTRINSNLLFENTLNYDKQIDKLNLSLLAGHSYQKFVTKTNLTDGNGFPSPSFDVNSVASVILAASSGISENSIESYFSRANLSYDDKYLLSVSFRTDGSSRFAPDHRWGYFPSVSGGWEMSKEPFWPMRSTSLKWRASYGLTGNQEGIGNYAYQALTGGGYNYNAGSGLAVTNPGSPNLTWESARQADIGFDLGLFDNHITFTADYFSKKTTNLLYDLPTMATSGFTSVTSNIGSMSNKGYEFTLGSNYDFGRVHWTSNFNISFIKNRLLSLIGNDPILVGGNKVLQVGKQVGSFYVYKQLGIYQRDDQVPASLYNTGVRAGDVIYKDVNKDGIIDVNDRQIVGTANPTYFGGWNNSITYRGFDLNFSFTYSYGNDIYASWRINVTRLGGTFFPNLNNEVNSRWTGPGTSNTVPRAIYGSTYNTQNSSRYLEDGSYIRFRNLSLGYSLPDKLIQRMKLKRLRVYVQADNLCLLTRYSGIDPEVNDNLDPKFMGDDNLVMPQPRIIMAGLNLTF